MENAVDQLNGGTLRAVEFVEDYLQLRFTVGEDEALITLFAWPDVADADGISVGRGQGEYRDALCSVIGEDVAEAQHVPGRLLTVEFENGTVLAVSLREEDLDTPEAGTLTTVEGELIEL